MRLRFVLSQLASGLRRNVSMTVSVVLVTFISLVFVGAALLLQMQIDNMKDDWYDRVEVSVFMCPADSAVPTCAAGEATDEQLAAIEDLLASDGLAPYVDEVYFETKEEAYEAFQEQMPDSVWTQSLTPDQMQVSFRIKLVDPEQYQVVADELSGRPGVEEVVDQRALLEPLFLILDRATLLAVALGGVMTVAAVLLITTTIRLSAMSRRRETSIMRLVGASNLFIQLPFMLEGALAALAGAALAVGGLWLAARYLVEGWLAQEFQWVQFVDTGDVLVIAPLLVLAAILLAGISSIVSLSRYTRV
ncbi:permease-like cell division protein FtsX [uncultured Georgenia sp.]|mgnify:CR=1 FL=1|uniref:permease-like cell division protein FtsX n=1 Tax=uncultured Georgenia sp. TaxID=378209 RepID=UPI0026185C00|nr:permease-like cell division protein FtsX [uncultured Georgenia sp.]HLV05275.1 permease-like cell division protein FtsX [Actinomycetaceae bacterium]